MPKVTNKERQRCWRYRTFLGGKERMSQADKLFEELGYEKNEFKNGVNYANDDDEISFVDYKDYGKTIDIDKSGCHLSLQELKAINMKCRELGWSDE